MIRKIHKRHNLTRKVNQLISHRGLRNIQPKAKAQQRRDKNKEGQGQIVACPRSAGNRYQRNHPKAVV